MANLHILAIVHDHSLSSIRSLDSSHLDLLKTILKESVNFLCFLNYLT